jgi:hypothetical protein
VALRALDQSHPHAPAYQRLVAAIRREVDALPQDGTPDREIGSAVDRERSLRVEKR